MQACKSSRLVRAAAVRHRRLNGHVKYRCLLKSYGLNALKLNPKQVELPRQFCQTIGLAPSYQKHLPPNK